MINKSVLILCVLTLSLVGCTSLKKVTGQTNDTILPGSREDVLPPDQTTARDPSITGGQPAPGTDIQQQTLAQPGMPQEPPLAQPGTPLQGHAGTVVTCDPLVESCPGMTPPPPSKPASTAKAPAGKVIVPPKAKTAASAKAATSTAPQAGASATAPAVAGQAPAVETVGTDPMKPEAKPVKKKKKKLVLKPKDPAVPDATVPGDATQAPPPLVPPDAQPQ